MDPRGPRGVVFLLSLGAIPIACDKDYSGDASATEGSATANASTSGSGTTDGSGSGSGTGSTTASTTASTTDATATGGMSATGTSSTGTPGDPADPCVAYVSKEAECNGWRYDALDVYYCHKFSEWRAKFYEASCATTYDALYTCIGGLTCAELESADGDPCPEIQAMLPGACQLVIGPLCLAYGDKAASCDPQIDPAEAAYDCQVSIVLETITYGDTCGQAYEELFACLTALSCPEFTGDMPCAQVRTCDDLAAPTSSK